MLFSAGGSESKTSVNPRLKVPVFWLGIVLAVGGCAETPPESSEPPKPVGENTEPREKPGEESPSTVPGNASVQAPETVDVVVPLTAEINFEGLSSQEKLDRIAEVIRSSWGDGHGFVYLPDAVATESSEDQLVLTLRWQSIEKTIAPLLQRAFGITGDLVCRFTSPGEFECNHPVYQLAIQQAQNRPSKFAVIHARIDQTLLNTAPVLRDQFLQQVGEKSRFYEVIRASLKGMALPEQLEFSPDETDSFADDEQCVLFTKWGPLPSEFEKSAEAELFQWRLKLVIREAIDAIESEWDNLRTEKNRLELVSFAQYRRGPGEPFGPVGPLSITAMGFDRDTTIQRGGKRFISRLIPADEVLGAPEKYSSAGAYPNPATFVGLSETMQTRVKSVHQAIQQHLTQSAAE